METIPIVYLWVDGNDPSYRARHNLTSATSRNRDNGELKYSLRSLEKYLPWWKGTLYIVTDKQTPSWLDIHNSRVKIVDHTDIIPKEFLPTRTSCTIEWFVHLIPEITDYFILMSDDVMFIRTCSPNTFMHNNKPILQFNKNILRNTKDNLDDLKKNNKMWLHNVYNDMNILEDSINTVFKNKFFIQHSPKIFSKKVIIQVHSLLHDKIKESIIMSKNDRIYGTLNTIYFITYYMAHILKLDIVPNNATEIFYEIYNSSDITKILEEIKSNTKDTFLCINDDFNDVSKTSELQKLFESLYPESSSFEVVNKI